MGTTRGGKKRLYKKKGSRKTASKQYQEYCREQHREGLVSNGAGGWMPIHNLRSDSIKGSYSRVCGSH